MCTFCEELKRAISYTKTHDMSFGIKERKGIHFEYGVFFVEFEMIGKEREGMTNFGYYRLRFCPECGASITRRMRQWKTASACGFGGHEP